MGIVATNADTELLAAVRELAQYRQQDSVATAINVGNSFYLVNEQWNRALVDDAYGGEFRRRAPKSPAEIMEHYRTCEMQVEQQVFATYGIGHQVALRRRVVEAIEPGSNVLDLGAGIGTMLLPLMAKGGRRTHADVGGVMMEYAAWRYTRLRAGPTGGHSKVYQVGGIEMVELADDYLDHAPFKDGAFDVVICTEVIEHVPEPEALVELLARLVKPGGLVVATTSFHDDEGTIPMHLPENLRRYDDESFTREIMPRYGLKPMEGAEAFYRR